jgi:hypothetical protein
MIRTALLLILAILCLGGAKGETLSGVYVRADSLSYSEPVPVRGYFNDWRTPFHGGERGLTYNYAEAGIFEGNWALGLVARYDEYLRFSPDTAELYYRTANHLPLQPGRRYVVDLHAQQFAARGLRLSFHYPLQPALSIGVGLSLLQGTQLTDGTLRGVADAINAKDYDYNVAVAYSYSEDRLFKRRVDAPAGRGYSFDLSLDWRTERLAAQLRVTDVIGRLYWHNAPYTTATATSNTKSYDADGYLIINPTLSGYEGNRSFTQHLPTRAYLKLRGTINERVDLIADIYYTQIKTFTPLGVSFGHTGGRAEVLYDWQCGAVTLGYRGAHFQAHVTSDRADWRRARTLGLSLEGYMRFN